MGASDRTSVSAKRRRAAARIAFRVSSDRCGGRPLPGGRHRIVATVDAAPEQPDAADVQALLDVRGPRKAPARVREVVWSAVRRKPAMRLSELSVDR